MNFWYVASPIVGSGHIDILKLFQEDPAAHAPAEWNAGTFAMGPIAWPSAL